MAYKIYQIDAFTDKAFTGNPAGVMILEEALPASLMQNIAAEMNLSETAFVDVSKQPYSIRFFTPTTEIALCGHATLASAHILYETNVVPQNIAIVFKTIKTQLVTSKNNNAIKIELPRFSVSPIAQNNSFSKIVGFEPIELFKFNENWVIAIAKDETDIINARPAFNEMQSYGLGHLVITSLSKIKNIDYVLRCFAPQSGINEDPVTGSIQCGLASLWNLKTGKTTFKTKQLSARTGIMDIRLTDSTVEIMGNAVTTFDAIMKV